MTAEKTNTKIITPTNQNQEKKKKTKRKTFGNKATDLHGD